MQERIKIKALLFFIVVLISSEAFLLHKYFFKNDTTLMENQKNCGVISETKYIRGISMEPLFGPEQEVTALMGYYNCHPVERNDIILVNYSGNDDPLIKQVKIISGDQFHVEKNGEVWNIYIHPHTNGFQWKYWLSKICDFNYLSPNQCKERFGVGVNGEILKNSEGKEYYLDEKRATLLRDYERQYQGIMPEDFYYILGNMSEGSVDSTRFGLIGKDQIIGKVAPKN